MSTTVLTATYRNLPGLRAAIESRQWGKHKPAWGSTVSVCLLLADKYRDSRGYVDETVQQIAEALVLTDGAVRDVLAALDAVGFWVKVTKGNQHRGTRRRPGFDVEAPRGNPAEHDEGASRGNPAELEAEHRGETHGASRDNDLSIAGKSLSIAGLPRDSPSIPITTPISSPRTDDLPTTVIDTIAADRTRRASERGDIDNPDAYQASIATNLRRDITFMGNLRRLCDEFPDAPAATIAQQLEHGNGSNLNHYRRKQAVS